MDANEIPNGKPTWQLKTKGKKTQKPKFEKRNKGDRRRPLTISKRSKVGLYNIGNSCYLNSTLQMLFHCVEKPDDKCQREAAIGQMYQMQEVVRKKSSEVQSGTAHVASFRNAALRCTSRETEKAPVLIELQRIFAYMVLSVRPVLKPIRFREVSNPSWLDMGEQQDCSEFLGHLLSQIYNELNPLESQAASGRDGTSSALTSEGSSGASTISADTDSEDSTLVRKAFGLKVQSTYRCLTCQQESSQVNDEMEISLSFPKEGSNTRLSPWNVCKQQGSSDNMSNEVSSSSSINPTDVFHMSELLGLYLAPEKLVDDNQYHCEHCGKRQDAERTMSILTSPQYLIITLKRFSFNTKLQRPSKVFDEVVCPPTIAIPVESNSSDSAASGRPTSEAARRSLKLLNDLNPKVISSVSATQENCDLYGLCSVVVHSGASLGGGHYYNFSRHDREKKDAYSVIDQVNNSQDIADMDFLKDEWCLFNDRYVSPVTKMSLSKLKKHRPKDTPYILVYKKLTFDAQKSTRGEVGLSPIHVDLCQEVQEDNIYHHLENPELPVDFRRLFGLSCYKSSSSEDDDSSSSHESSSSDEDDSSSSHESSSSDPASLSSDNSDSHPKCDSNEDMVLCEAKSDV